MKIEIDQSNKVEQTSKSTVVAFSDGINRSIELSSKEKQILQKYFRSIGKPRLFVLLTFCALVYMLVESFLDSNLEMAIDREYTGYDQLIKQKIIGFARIFRKKLDKSQITFREIGKKSAAHQLAYFSAQKKIFNQRITAKQIVELLEKQKSGNA